VSTAGVTKSAPSTNPAGNGVGPFEVMMVSSPLLPVKADAQPPRHRRDFRRDRPNRRFFGQIGAELHY